MGLFKEQYETENTALRKEVEELKRRLNGMHKTAEELRNDVLKWQRIRTPTHGSCCTCGGCGNYYDECRCDLDSVCDELEQLQQKYDALVSSLKARLDEHNVGNARYKGESSAEDMRAAEDKNEDLFEAACKVLGWDY